MVHHQRNEKFSLNNQYDRAIADIESEDELPRNKVT